MKTKELTLLCVLLLAPRLAIACACAPHNLSDDVRKAKTIYRARVVSAREVIPADKERYPYVIASLKVLDSLKGDAIPEDTREIKFTSPCSVGVQISAIYVVFEDAEGQTGRCEGTVQLDGQHRRKDEELVESIRATVERQVASN